LTASCSDHFTSDVRTPRTHWKGGWVGLRADLDVEAEIRFPSLPVPGMEIWQFSLYPSYYTD